MSDLHPNEVLSRELHELLQSIMRSDLPAESSEELLHHIRAAHRLVTDFQREVQHGAASEGAVGKDWHWDEEHLSGCMNRSPVSGRRNPVAPPIRMWRDGDEVRGEAIFPPTHAGPPDCVHGGVIAATFDELLAMPTIVHGVAGFTGHLYVSYHQPTPLEKPLALHGWVEKQSGRKVVAKGTIMHDGVVTASAEGLFIQPRQGVTASG